MSHYRYVCHIALRFMHGDLSLCVLHICADDLFNMALGSDMQHMWNHHLQHALVEMCDDLW